MNDADAPVLNPITVGKWPPQEIQDRERTRKSFAAMRSRCNNPRATGYENYGGRGIKVCDRWQTFPAFLKDMGIRPSGTQLDRIDNNGDYEPGNCRWASVSDQNRNRRSNVVLTAMVNGIQKTKCATEWAEISGTDMRTIVYRFKVLQWDAHSAIFGSSICRCPHCGKEIR